MKKETAARILEYLDRCPLGGPGTAGMHQERLEMNQIVGELVEVCNAPDEPPPEGGEEDPPTPPESDPDE